MIKSLFLLLLFLFMKLWDGCVSVWNFSVHKLKQYRVSPHINLKLPRIEFPDISLPRVPAFSFLSFARRFPMPPMRKSLKQKKRRRIPQQTQIRYKTSIWYKLKFVLFGIFVSCILVFLPLTFFIFISDLPNPNNLSLDYVPKTTKIFDRHGKLLYEIYANQNRTLVTLPSIPKNLQNATIAIEDKDFYSHPGFDVRGILRAFLVDIHHQNLQGGSTITQQLIRAAFLTPDPTIIRKVKEVVLAFWAERIYTKQQILEMYLNYVSYGGTAWGVESASEIYFNEHVQDLDLAQSAFLAGLPQAPSVYSPYASASQSLWKQRQKEVLTAMVQQHYINQKQANQALAEQLTFQSPQVPLQAPHFVMYVKDLLEQKYGENEVERGGLQVTTSLDLDLQNQAQQIVTSEVAQDQSLGISNGATLITNPSTGDILAMVGSANYFDLEHDGNVNLTTALRQPGSTIKVVTYSLALSHGYTEETPIDDSPLTLNIAGESYTPVNYDGKFHGRLPLRMVLGNSLNIPAVRVASQFGVPAIVAQGQKMGVSSWKNPNNYGISITLGGADTTMTDLATVFGTIADQGNRVDLNPILEIKDANGTILYKKNPTPQPVLDPGVAFILSDILSDNANRAIEFGPNTPLVIPGHKVAVKTGTTDEKRDNWTIGYTPNYLVATWVGNNDNSPMNPALASGITGAAPMWNKIMSSLLQGKTDPPLSIPSDIVTKQCNGRTDYFISGTENSVGCFGFTPFSPTPTSH